MLGLEADQIIDRRKLTRSRSFWRVLGILALGVSVVTIGFAFGGKNLDIASSNHIARININGMITGDKATMDVIKRVENSKASAVIIGLDSPGGTTAGSEMLYERLLQLGKKKPIVSVVSSTAASGAYIAALATDHIVAPGNAIVGSIGVIAQYPNVTKLLENIGVTMESVRSSPLKAQPSGMEPTLPAARVALEATILDSFEWFKGLVKERRKLNDDELKKVADGRVFTGRQGLPLKLIDAIGGEKQAITWLEKEKKITANLPIREYKAKSIASDFAFLDEAKAMISLSGFPKLAQLFGEGRKGIEAKTLDGMFFLWQPSTEK